MEDDLDLRNFRGLTRLFPLPGVVLFPHAVLPLHIFEPRYRRMTEDALNDNKLVTIVQLRPPSPGMDFPPGLPPIESVGCLGRILQHERLSDGRFNFLLLGRKRVRLGREVTRDSPYRVAEVEVLEDLCDDPTGEPWRSDLTALFRSAFERQGVLDPDLASILENALPLGVLTDIVSHAMGLPPEVKQSLLAEPRVGARAEVLLSVLRDVLGPDNDERGYPPPFSAN